MTRRGAESAEREVMIPSRGLELRGTLRLPSGDGPFPTLLYLSGSGPFDRSDSTSSLSLGNSTALCSHLAQSGIASLCYDKRGVGDSDGDFESADHSDHLDDAEACVRYLTQHPHCEPTRLFIAGHSEGALIAVRLAYRQPVIAGVILLAPFCEQMDSLLMRQADQLRKERLARRGIAALALRCAPKLFDPVVAQSRLIERLSAPASPTSRMRSVLRRSTVPSAWLRELLALDIAQQYTLARAPALILSGSKDLQCRPEDALTIQALYGGVAEAHVIEDMSHLLRREEREASLARYSQQLSRALMPEVATLASEWLERQLAVARDEG